MNHTFTTRTWTSITKTTYILGIITSIVLILFIVTALFGIAGLIFTLFLMEGVICPSCKKKVWTMRGALAFSCHYCQAVVGKRNNQWKIMD